MAEIYWTVVYAVSLNQEPMKTYDYGLLSVSLSLSCSVPLQQGKVDHAMLAKCPVAIKPGVEIWCCGRAEEQVFSCVYCVINFTFLIALGLLIEEETGDSELLSLFPAKLVLRMQRDLPSLVPPHPPK
jgi:hypothetical protein